MKEPSSASGKLHTEETDREQNKNPPLDGGCWLEQAGSDADEAYGAAGRTWTAGRILAAISS